MSKSKVFIVAALALGVTSGVSAQQQPRGTAATATGAEHDVLRHRRRARQGRRSRRHRGRRRALPDAWRRATARAGKPGAPISAPRRPHGKPAVNARDRIGNGPWQNFKGQVVATSVDDLHSDNNKLSFDNSLSERGFIIPGVGFAPNRHDVLTGSTPEGRAFPAAEDRTCRNWTSSTQGAAMLGHIDRKGLRDDAAVAVVEFVASLARARRRLQPERSARHRRRRTVLLLRHPVRRR